MQTLLRDIFAFWPPLLTFLIVAGLLLLNNYIYRRHKTILTTRGSFLHTTFVVLVLIIGTITFLFSSPMSHEEKTQILSFLGIVISAGIALSSTTVLGNLIAGLMNNTMKRFRSGDLIEIGEMHGRVVTKSLFHTEIQLEDSNFITIPNLYIAQNPVKLTRRTNSVISCSVSLGYDVPRVQIETALINAAKATELKDPYVYITALGDFSVVYKIHGFLENVDKFFSKTSQLHAMVMDKLHEAGIEIVSPSFMNQRQINDKIFTPEINYMQKQPTDITVNEPTPEEKVFDKAMESAQTQRTIDTIKALEIRINELKAREKIADRDEKEEIQEIIQHTEKKKENLNSDVT